MLKFILLMFDFSAIIGRNVELFKVYLFKFIYAMPAVSMELVSYCIDCMLLEETDLKCL